MEHVQGSRLFLLSLAIGIAAFLVSLDGFIVNVAIPTISGELGVRVDAGTWMITLFTMASTLFVPLSGWLSKRVGAVALFSYATLGFTFFSYCVGASSHFPLLLIFRVLQGAMAGILVPLSLSLIILNFPPEKRSVAIGFWSFFVMVGPALGPMVGGWLSDHLWPWMFYINIPLGLFSALTLPLILKNEVRIKERLDVMGVSLLFIGIGALQIALNRGNIDDWFRSPFITTLFIVSLLALTLFFIWEKFHPAPFIDLSYFAHKNFFLGALFLGVGMALLFSGFVLDSLWVQKVLGYTPAWAGLTLTPVGIFPLLFYPLMGRFLSFLDIRLWLALSFLLFGATFYWMSRMTMEISFWQLALPRLIQGIGFALFTVPTSMIAIEEVKEERMTFVISLFSFTRMLCVGFGIALSITLWSHREALYQMRFLERIYPGSAPFQEITLPFVKLGYTPLQAQSLANDLITAQSLTLALADIYYFFSLIFFAMTPFIFLFKRYKQHSTQ